MVRASYACGVHFSPLETKHHHGICPQCEKSLTVGVVHRVDKLADRAEGFIPPRAPGVRRIVPRAEIIAEAFGVVSITKRARAVRATHRARTTSFTFSSTHRSMRLRAHHQKLLWRRCAACAPANSSSLRDTMVSLGWCASFLKNGRGLLLFNTSFLLS